jgi:hypothetical protein
MRIGVDEDDPADYASYRTYTKLQVSSLIGSMIMTSLQTTDTWRRRCRLVPGEHHVPHICATGGNVKHPEQISR